jgi:hypothetical protein
MVAMEYFERKYSSLRNTIAWLTIFSYSVVVNMFDFNRVVIFLYLTIGNINTFRPCYAEKDPFKFPDAIKLVGISALHNTS